MPPLTLETQAAVAGFSWPGNVRQLENAVCRALAMAGPGGELSAADLLPPGAAREEPGDLSLARAVRQAEKSHIEMVLAMCGGNRSRTASVLGISRKNLWEKMKQLGIEDSGE